MQDGIGKKLAEEFKGRTDARLKLEEAETRKIASQKASDGAALESLVGRLREEVESFNQNAGQLPPLSLTRADELGPHVLNGVKQLEFSIEDSRLQITVLPSHSPLFSTVQHGATGYTYLHIGHNGMATNRESTEDQIVETLMRQVCGL